VQLAALGEDGRRGRVQRKGSVEVPQSGAVLVLRGQRGGALGQRQALRRVEVDGLGVRRHCGCSVAARNGRVAAVY